MGTRHRNIYILHAFLNSIQRQHHMNKRHVSQSGCAEVFAVHRNTVANWLKQGCPYVQKANKKQGKDWVLDTAEVAQWRADRAVLDAVGNTELATEDELKRRKLAAETTVAEVTAAQAKGRVIPKDDVEKAIRNLCIELQTQMMLIGKRCFPQNVENRILVDDEVRTALNNATSIELDYDTE